MMSVLQIIMLHTLNLYSAVCQLHFNKAGQKKFFLIKTYRQLLTDTFCWLKREVDLTLEI